MVNYESFNLTEDHCYNIRRALLYCREHQEDGLVFPKGEYHLYPGKASVRAVSVSNHDICGYNSIAFLLENMRDFTLDGGGSVFISHGVMVSAALLSCSNVRLQNLSFTAEEPMRMEAEVVGYSGKDWILRVTNDAGYYIRDGMLRFTDAYGHDDPYHYTMIVRRGEGTDYIPETKESFDKNVRFYQMEGRKIRVQNSQLSPEAGMRLILAPQIRHGCTVFLENCRDTLIERLAVCHSYGMGVIAQLCDTITIRGMKVGTGGAMFSTNCDATHFVSCTGKIEISGSSFEGMLDDAMNIHGIFSRIEQADERGILVHDMHPGSKGLSLYEPGDRIAVMNPGRLIPESFYTVEKAERINMEYFYLTLRERAEHIPVLYTVENISRQPEVFFCNNTVRANRARGILLASKGRTEVRNNVFHTPGCAVLFESDGEMWYESGGTQDVLIEDNLFDHCGYAREAWGEAVIEIKPRREADGIHYYHKKIRISNNRFTGKERMILSAADTEEIEFSGNEVPENEKANRYRNCGHILDDLSGGRMCVQ